jgi:hypothetical protein
LLKVSGCGCICISAALLEISKARSYCGCLVVHCGVAGRLLRRSPVDGGMVALFTPLRLFADPLNCDGLQLKQAGNIA